MINAVLEISIKLIPSFLAFVAFGLFHSVCAQERFKEWLGKVTHPYFVEYFWRFIYCVGSFTLFYFLALPLIFQVDPYNREWVSLPEWTKWVINAGDAVGLAVCYVAFLQADYLEFWGLKQMWRGFKKLLNPAAENEQEMKIFGTNRLVIRGIYRWIRHPMLAGGFMIVFFSPLTSLNLILTFYFFVYLAVGVFYEEKRLIRNFGNDYLNYKRDVKGFIPGIF